MKRQCGQCRLPRCATAAPSGHVVRNISPSSCSPGALIGVSGCPSRSSGRFLVSGRRPGGRSSTCRLDTPPRLDNSVDNYSQKQKHTSEGVVD